MIRDIHELYRQRSQQDGNINEHLPLLYMLSQDSKGVVELGVERGISTSAIMAGQADRICRGLEAYYTGVDINPSCGAEINRLANICRPNLFPVNWIEGQSTTAGIPQADFLLIDSKHSEEVIREELKEHLPKIRKYVAMHDTVSFGEIGEIPGTRGILYGIDALNTPEWLKVYDSPRNHGMAVYRRVG